MIALLTPTCARAAAALLLCFLGVLNAGCVYEDQTLTLVKPRLEIDQQIAEDFARLFDTPGELQIELIDNPDPEQPGLHAVKMGLADLALVPNTEAYDPRVATVVPLYPTVLHIAYRFQGDEPPDQDLIAGLTENTVYAGPAGSPSRLLLETAARRDGVDPESINYVSETDACADIVVLYAAVLPDLSGRIEGCGEYRLYSLAEPEEIGTGSALDSVTLLNPNLKPFVIPADTYGRLTPEPVVTLAVDKLLVAGAEVPEAVVYDLLSEILRLKPALSATHPGLFHQLTDDFDISGAAFVMHPGALAYVQRDEPGIYERYSGIAEVVVTLMIGLVSGIYAIFKIYTIRQKNRIDAFCQRALDLRDDCVAGGKNAAATIEALKALQDEAYDLMIHERLAADESFRIFVTLSNDLIADLSGVPRSAST
ncbi:MAG: TAXI family TRAP transporter solute-binding subunit [Pseudomonadota bacterium]